MDQDVRHRALSGASQLDLKNVGVLIAPETLKCCDLCHALNLEVNRECFVCGWKGFFDRDPARIHHALHRLRLRNLEITPLLFTDEETLHQLCRRQTLWSRCVFWVKYRFKRLSHFRHRDMCSM